MDIIDREIVDDSHGIERPYNSHTTGLFVAMLLISPGLYYLSAINYLVFHTSVEIVGVLIAFSIFVVGWNTRGLTKNNMMLIMSVGYLVVGILSIFHTFSYPGMRVFIVRESYISTQFWIGARYVEAATLFLAVYFLRRKERIREWVWLGIFSAIGTIITVTIFLGVFPDSYIAGQGLTTFKIVSEYIISAILAISGLMLWRTREYMNKRFISLMLGAIFLTILSELTLTLYMDIYGFISFLGHLFMIFSLLFIYRILVEDYLSTPFNFLFKEIAVANEQLFTNEKKFRNLVEQVYDWVFEIDTEGRLTYSNPSAVEHTGIKAEDMLGRNYFNLLKPDKFIENKATFNRAVLNKSPILNKQDILIHDDGSEVVLEVNKIPIYGAEQELVGFRGIGRNITKRRMEEDVLKESEEKYRSLITQMDQEIVVYEMIHDQTGVPRDYCFVDTNESYLKSVRMSKVDVIGKRASEIFPDTYQEKLLHYDAVVKTGKTYTYETYLAEMEKHYYVMAYRYSKDRFAVISTDITDYKNLESKLRLAELEKEIILSNMTELVIYYGADNRIKWANQSAVDFFLLEPGTYEGTYDYELASHNNDAIENSPLRLTLKEQKTQQAVVTVDGGENLLVTTHPVMDDSGSLVGVVEVSQNISERIRYEHELKKAREESEWANLDKGRFLANMSHEIRNPLNVIMGMANLASEVSDDLKKKNYIEMIQHSASSLLGLLNDLLEYSKIEAHKVRIIEKPFSLAEEVSRIVFTLTDRAKEKGLNLRYFIEKGIPDRLIGDAGKINQILLNFIGNAIKFTEQGGIVVRISMSDLDEIELDRSEGDIIEIHFSVSDTGIGIPLSKHDKLFSLFAQVHDDLYKYEGVGLGLPISKNLVELMGGTIGATSVEGEGSDFYFDIPLKVHSRGDAKETYREADIQRTRSDLNNRGALKRNLSVLVVEDKPMNQVLIKDYLEKEGHHVVLAGNGYQALVLIENESFDLVLMDIKMPYMDGIEATRSIRALEGQTSKRIPIIAMTAYDQPEDQILYQQAGFDYLIAKPINIAALYLGIDLTMKKAGSFNIDQVFSDEEIQHMLDRLDGNMKLLGEMTVLFLEDYVKEKEMVELSIEKSDSKSLSDVAHALKGELGNLGMETAYKIATDLQKSAENHKYERAVLLLNKLEQEIEKLRNFASKFDC